MGWGAAEPPAIVGLRERVESGDVEAMALLGNAYANGDGVEQSDVEAFRYYKRAAELGHASAQFSVGVMSETGQGTRLDQASAFRAYLNAAEQGWGPAQTKVADMFTRGVGTSRNDTAAFTWYRKAALNGMPEAQYHLAVAYEQGRGASRDRDEARKWYQEAADQGYDPARFNLALMLETGIGSSADISAAAELYRIAAERGFAPAQNNYGLLLAEGRGSIAIDLVEAYAWLTIAVESGANPAGRNLVSRKLNPAQLTAAQERAANIRAAVGAGILPAALERAPSPLRRSDAVDREIASPVRSVTSAAEQSALKAEILALSTEVRDLSRTNQNLRLDHERLTQENLKLATALRAVPAAGASVAESAVPPGWRKEREALEVAVQEALSRVAAADEQVVQLKVAVKGAEETDARNQALTKQNAELAESLQRLTTALDQLRVEHAQLSEAHSKLLTEVAATKNAGSAREADTAAQNEAATEIATLRLQLEQVTAKLSEAERARADLQRLQSTASDQSTTVNLAAAPMPIVAAEVEEQSGDMAKLTAIAEKLTRDNSDLRRQVELLRAESSLLTQSQNSPSVTEAADLWPTDIPAVHGVIDLDDPAGLPPPETPKPVRLPPTRRAVVAAPAVQTASSRNVSIQPDSALFKSPLLTSPRSRPAVAALRLHTVVQGESLIQISERYYGTGDRWKEIYQANREGLRGQTRIRIGQQLRVP
jgi:TPR repeat protein/nucleoid-associated protein YgaU